jgi:carbamoyltransferase
LRSKIVEQWHKDLAFAVQNALEEAATRLVRWAIIETGVSKVCVGGGVGLNVKMNARLAELPEVTDVFANPLCADGGAAAGAALVACYQTTGVLPRPLESLALGPRTGVDETSELLMQAAIQYERPDDLCDLVARELSNGRIVGWCEGRMEAGPRALGHRSILADPRKVEIRDRVNAIVKHREEWRPFAPSIPCEALGTYVTGAGDPRFMTMAFRATDRLRAEAPAVVHTDGTCRAHGVSAHSSPTFYRLLAAFGALTGVPVLLNTSFNVAGEPIVCSAEDALRTFWSTGLDVLVIDDLIVRKQHPRAASAADGIDC